MLKYSLFILLGITLSCSTKPVVNQNYNFKEIGTIDILPIKDYKSTIGSGEMVQSSLDYNFLKYGFEVINYKSQKRILVNTLSEETLILSCIITELTESESIIVPYRTEDRGYTKTTINQSSESNKETKENELSATSTTTTHAGTVNQGSQIVYSQNRISLILTLTDKKSGRMVWSKSCWYSGLELQRTINMCLKDGIYELRKVLK